MDLREQFANGYFRIPRQSPLITKSKSVPNLHDASSSAQDNHTKPFLRQKNFPVDASQVEEPQRILIRRNTLPKHGCAYDKGESLEVGESPYTTDDLIDAAGCGNLEEVRWILRSHRTIAVNALSTRPKWLGNTALHAACIEGQQNVVKTLLAFPGVNVNTPNSIGFTPLHTVCTTPIEKKYWSPQIYASVIKDLLDIPSIDVNNASNEWRLTPLHVAFRAEDGFCVQQLLRHQAINVEVQDNEGCLPLHLAAETSSLSPKLGPLGPMDVDRGFFGGQFQEIPLSLTSQNLHPPEDDPPSIGEVIGTLLRLGRQVNLSVTTNRGLIPLHLAAANKNFAAVEALLKHAEHRNHLVNTRAVGTRDTALHMAMPDVRIATLLLEARIDPMMQNEDGNTALHKCCIADFQSLGKDYKKKTKDFVNAVRILSKRLPHAVNAKNNDGHTVLHLILRAFRTETIHADGLLTIPVNWDVNVQDHTGETPLHLAIRLGDLGIVKQILAMKGVLINTPNEEGETALHVASSAPRGSFSSHAIVEMLLEKHKAGVDELTDEGWTALHLAAHCGHRETVAVLLKNGANPRISTGQPFAPDAATVASNADHIEVAEFIRSEFKRQKVRLEVDEHHRENELNSQYHVWIWPRACGTPLSGQQKRVDQRFPPYVRSVAAALYSPATMPDDLTETGGVLRRIEIPPEISQWQMRFAACIQNGWTWHMGDKSLQEQCSKNQRTQLRWLHFPVNNRTWVEDFCRVAYRHVSLRTELIDILSFIHDTFDEVDRKDPHRDCAFHSASLPVRTDKGHGEPLFTVTEVKKSLVKKKIVWGASEAEEDIRHEVPATGLQSKRSSIIGIMHSNAVELTKESNGDYSTSNKHHGDNGDNSVPSDPISPGKGNAKPDVADESRPEEYTLASIVMPFIDIDNMWPGFIDENPLNLATNMEPSPRQKHSIMLAEFDKKFNKTEKDHNTRLLHSQKMAGSHKARTLDHYFHRELNEQQVQDANSNQVLSRFIHHQRQRRPEFIAASKPGEIMGEATPVTLAMPTAVETSQSSLGTFINTGDRSLAFEAGPDVEGQRITKGENLKSAANPDSKQNTVLNLSVLAQVPRQRVIVVPQLWLWKIDNVLVTTCSERWDFSGSSTLAELIRNKVEGRVPSQAKDGELLHDILEACLEFQPSFTAFGRQLTYHEAFSGEIARISREIAKGYELFREGLGTSDDRFFDAFEVPTDCMVEIDDVLNEITMIRRVHEDQVQVWEDLHERPGRDCKCDPDNLPHVQRLNSITQRLEEDALKVRESVTTLLSLLQGEASTENALKTTQQSRILTIFTVVTVVFTPLSWISALFALNIQHFTSGTGWTITQVAAGSVVSVVGTFGLCWLGWVWLSRNNLARRGARTREWGPRNRRKRVCLLF